MKLICPSCGCHGAPEVFMTEADAGAEDLAALAMPSQIAPEIQQYLRLFRPRERALLARRRHKLLAELLPHIQAAKLDFDGHTWPAPLDYWREAIGQMLTGKAKLALPLANHNYLYRIVAGLSKRDAGAAPSAPAEAAPTVDHPEPQPAVQAGGWVYPEQAAAGLREFVKKGTV